MVGLGKPSDPRVAVWFLGRMIRLPPLVGKSSGHEGRPEPIGDNLPGQAFSKYRDHFSLMHRSRQRIESLRLRSIGECADIQRNADRSWTDRTILSWTRLWIIVAMTVW